MSTQDIHFELASLEEKDGLLVMQWRNDPETRKASIHEEVKFWQSFQKEYHAYFLCKDLPPLFILFEGIRAGFVYFKTVPHPEALPNRSVIEVSIQIAPEFRGKKIATAALEKINLLALDREIDDLFAIIKKDNEFSIKAFKKAGYEQIKSGTIQLASENIAVDRFIKRISKQKTPVFIIAEAGSNWRVGDTKSDLEMAYQLIEKAKIAKASAIKFQVFRPNTIYVKNAGSSGYLSDSGITMDMQELFEDLSMPYEMIPLIKNHCDKVGIEFMATAFSKADFLAIDPFVKRHKIASYELGHIRLLELVAQSGKPAIISTGAATEEEIDWAVDTYKKNGGKDLTLLQCTAKYPAEVASLNLRAIKWLKKRYQCDVGLSDHSLDPILAPISAVTLGALVIEKHFTIDKKLKGPDHSFAVNPVELKMMVEKIRETEQMLGSFAKEIDSSEKELRSFARRGIQAITDIEEGDFFQEGVNIDILRPGNQTIGIHPKFIDELDGKKATRSISLGDGIQMKDWL